MTKKKIADDREEKGGEKEENKVKKGVIIREKERNEIRKEEVELDNIENKVKKKKKIK